MPWCPRVRREMWANALRTASSLSPTPSVWSRTSVRRPRCSVICRSCQASRIPSTSGKYLYKVALPIPAFSAIWDIVTDRTPCSAASSAVDSRIASCTARRCASIVSFHSFGTRSVYAAPTSIHRGHCRRHCVSQVAGSRRLCPPSPSRAAAVLVHEPNGGGAGCCPTGDGPASRSGSDSDAELERAADGAHRLVPDDRAGPWGVQDLPVARVEADMVQISEEEHQVAYLEVAL